MKHFKLAAFLLTLVAATATVAGEEKLYIFTSQLETTTAMVEAIDHDTREVTLRGSGGGVISFTADEEVRNLAHVGVGDIVTVESVQNLSVEVYEDAGVDPTFNELTAEERAELGEMPGITTFDVQVISATVVAIDLEDNTFKLQWPDESIEKFTAQNPENLRKAAIGDLVVITQTDKLAISVEKARDE